MLCPVIELAKQLISRPSISPEDAGCQELLCNRLLTKGFQIEDMSHGDTRNFWATHGVHDQGPTFVLVGHTDVVPIGDKEKWNTPPFQPTIIGDLLYGRGAADMKGNLSSMIIAAERFVSQYPKHTGLLAFLVTSDEENSAVNGTVKVVEKLINCQQKIDYCLVGEPSSRQYLGDVIKIGRRGCLTANLHLYGIQGHVAYPHLAKNPIHYALPILNKLINKTWDEGNSYFPPTSMQIANIQGGYGTSNVIPGELYVQFNFRFNNESTVDSIKERVIEIIETSNVQYKLEWTLSGLPFLTSNGELIAKTTEAIDHFTGRKPELSTAGGTSDGRFIATMGEKIQIVELGVINDSIHKVNENVSCSDLQLLSKIYQRIMESLLH